MSTVDKLLKTKGHEIISIEPSATVFDAVKKMSESEVGALIVLEGDKPMGIVTERDYARKIILAGLSSKDTLVGDIMTSKLIYATPEQTAHDCMATMSENRIRHLPVIEGNGKLLGVLSVRDLMLAVISEQQFLIDQLEHYVSS